MNKIEIQDTAVAGGGEHSFDPVHQQAAVRVSQGDQEDRSPLTGARFLAPGDVLDRADFIFRTPQGIKAEPGLVTNPSHDLIVTPEDAAWLAEVLSLPDNLLLEALTHHRPFSKTCRGFPTLERT